MFGVTSFILQNSNLRLTSSLRFSLTFSAAKKTNWTTRWASNRSISPEPWCFKYSQTEMVEALRLAERSFVVTSASAHVRKKGR